MDKNIIFGLLGSLLAGLLTVLGMFFILFKKDFSNRFKDISLGFSAGIMLSASFFSLLNPSIKILETSHNSKIFVALLASFGFSLGSLIFWLVDKFIPEEYFIKFLEKDGDKTHIKKIWLFVLAITVHNFPEGMSSALGFLTGDIGKGIAVASGIGIQNIPEGLAIGLALLIKGYSKIFSFLIVLISGLVEFVGGFFGILTFGLYKETLPIGLSFAAGAMIFVISKEIIPETHKSGFEMEATTGLIAGFILMMILDIALG